VTRWSSTFGHQSSSLERPYRQTLFIASHAPPPNHPSPPSFELLTSRMRKHFHPPCSSAALPNLLLHTHNLLRSGPGQRRPSSQTSLRLLKALALLFLFPVDPDHSSRDADRDCENGIQSSARIGLDGLFFPRACACAILRSVSGAPGDEEWV
jgi:hypothetical protein